AIRHDGSGIAERDREKACELGLAHLAAGECELAVPYAAETADMSIDLHIIWRVGEHEIGALITHQSAKYPSVLGIAADQPMAIQQPDIAALRHCGPP